MSSNNLFTLYAPAHRYDNESLVKQKETFEELSLFKQGLDATNSMILILNSYRQAVFANKAFLKMMNMKDISELMGKRPGEIIECIHACTEINGCGTSAACRYCSLLNAVLQAMTTNEEVTAELSNSNRMKGYEENINWQIHVAPLPVNQEIYYVVSLTDNSDAIQKRILERTFFHDIINTVGALKGIVGLLKDDVPNRMKPEIEFVEKSFKYLVEEIQTQKWLMDAENEQLVMENTVMDSMEILKSVSNLYIGHDIAIDKAIILDSHCISKNITTDQSLLRRVLGNMIKNALEATNQGGKIILGCSMDAEEEYIKFWVHNDNYMDERVKTLVFHRSFSTKGEGRGIGTYSMKLFGEKFLKGQVNFISNKEEGTTFYIKIPLLVGN